MLNVLMVGVGPETRGGMWAVAHNYLQSTTLGREVRIQYVSTATSVAANPAVKMLRAIKGCRKAISLMNTGSIDLVHVHMAERGSYFRKAYVAKQAVKRGIPVIIHMHGGEFDSFYEQADGKTRAKIRHTLSQVQAVVVLDQRFKGWFSDIGVNADKIYVLPNAVSVPDASLYSDDSRDVIFMGAMSVEKGITEYLDAIKMALPQLREEYRFKLFGPPLDLDVEREIAKRDLGSSVSYEGFLAPADQPAQYARSALAVLPSRSEVFPMTILETMSYGIPNVATDVGAAETVVHDGANGLLVPPQNEEALSDALVAVLNDHVMRKRFSREAYNTIAQGFSQTVHEENLLYIYHQITK